MTRPDSCSSVKDDMAARVRTVTLQVLKSHLFLPSRRTLSFSLLFCLFLSFCAILVLYLVLSHEFLAYLVLFCILSHFQVLCSMFHILFGFFFFKKKKTVRIFVFGIFLRSFLHKIVCVDCC